MKGVFQKCFRENFFFDYNLLFLSLSKTSHFNLLPHMKRYISETRVIQIVLKECLVFLLYLFLLIQYSIVSLQTGKIQLIEIPLVVFRLIDKTFFFILMFFRKFVVINYIPVCPFEVYEYEFPYCECVLIIGRESLVSDFSSINYC